MDPCIHDEYDPQRPNDFDEIFAKKQRSYIEHRKALEEKVLGVGLNESKEEYQRYRLREEERREEEEIFIPTQPVQLDLDVSGDEVFLRRMKLSEKSKNPARPLLSSHIVMISNLANYEKGVWQESDLEELAFDLCSKNGGMVIKCESHQIGAREYRIFAEFQSVPDAQKAASALDQSVQNGGKVITAVMYDERRFNEMELDD